MNDVGRYKLRIEGIQCVLPSTGTLDSGTVHTISSILAAGPAGYAGAVAGGIVTVGSDGTLTVAGVAAGVWVFAQIEGITQVFAEGGRAIADAIGATMPDQVYVKLDGKKIFPKSGASKDMKAGDYAEIGVEVDRGTGPHSITINEWDWLSDDLLYSVDILESKEVVRVAFALDGESDYAKDAQGSVYLLWLTATRDRGSREIVNAAHEAMLEEGKDTTIDVRAGLGFWTVAQPTDPDEPDGAKEQVNPPLYTDFIGGFGTKGFDGWANRTIKVEAVDDRVFCLGRTRLGMEIYEVMGGDWELRGTCQRFKDGGWKLPKHYKTIQTAVLDDKLFLLGRGAKGMEIYAWDLENEYWSQVLDTCTRFRSPAWDPNYHTETIQTFVFRNRLYLAGRGEKGMDFYLWTGKKWDPALQTATRFKNPNWTLDESYWRTIQTVVTGNDLHLVGRGSKGVEIWTWREDGWRKEAAICERFKDPNWKKACYADTIQVLALDDRIVVIGRGAKGVDAYVWDGRRWSGPIESGAFSDKAGGKKAHVWASIHATVYDGRIWMVGNARQGAEIHVLDVAKRSWTSMGTIETFAEAGVGEKAGVGKKKGVARTMGFVETRGRLLVHGRVPAA